MYSYLGFLISQGNQGKSGNFQCDQGKSEKFINFHGKSGKSQGISLIHKMKKKRTPVLYKSLIRIYLCFIISF